MRFFGKTPLILAVAVISTVPMIARLSTKQIGYVTEHARELVGKSLWVDGCVNSQIEGKLFQLGDGTGAISVLSASEVPVAGTCMELNGVVRLHETAGITRYILEERERKVR
jgi:hypothetical protein